MAKQTFTTGQVLTAAQMTSLQQTAMGGGSTTAKTTSYVLTAADAGTVVAMNAAGATTITVNTGLFSAGDTVFIQNWGAGTCTVTAGTATVTTHGSLALGQWEGGTLYFTSASAAIFFDISQTSGMTNPMTNTGDTIYSSSGSTPARLAIGSTGQVLTVSGGVPSWATPSSGGGMTLISTTTLSGSSTTFSSIDQGYVNLFLVGNIISTNDCAINLYYNSDTTNANYNVYFTQGYGGTFNHTNRTSGNICETISSSAWNTKNYTQLWIYRYAAAENHYAVSVSRTGFPGSGVDFRDYMARHVHTGTSAITSITLNATAGTLSGTVSLYGVK